MVNNKMRLQTPLGRVQVLIDGKEIDYSYEKLAILENCSDVKGRYRIRINFVPDGNAHTISCVLPEMVDYKSSCSSDDAVQQISFHNKEKWALEMGVFGDVYGFDNRSAYNEAQDYDVAYLGRGLCYLILTETATQVYDFILAWIDGIDYDDYASCRDRVDQLWRCSDPCFVID